MKIIFIGPQGSGKGTQAKIIAKELKICHISTGDMLRSTEGELKKQVDEVINEGNLVSDNLILKILKQRITKEDCKNGFILDGFPRNQKQAEMLKQVTDIDKVIEITLPDQEAIKRLSSRLSCKCGATFNTITNPPEKENICDACGRELFQREDDTPEAIQKRLDTYHKDTEPLLQKYDSIKINGNQPIKDISQDILNVLR